MVVIDEYPYLSASDKSISSRLQSYIDGEWKESKMYLILMQYGDTYFKESVLPQIPDYMGSIFEDMCRFMLVTLEDLYQVNAGF